MLQLPGVLRIELPRLPDYQRLAMQQPTFCVLLGWKRAYCFNPLPGLVADQLRRRAVFLRGQQARSFGLLASQHQPQPRKSPKKPQKVGATAAATHQQAGQMAQATPQNPNICGKNTALRRRVSYENKKSLFLDRILKQTLRIKTIHYPQYFTDFEIDEVP